MMNFSSLRNKQQQGGVVLYTIIAVLLMVITYAEFAIVEYQDALPLGRGATLFWLFALSIVKYALVVWIFMHLKDDEKLLTGLFSVGMLIGGGTVAALLLAFTVFNVNKVQRSPYMPTTNYARSTYDRMGIAEFAAPDFVDSMDNPAPKNQLFAVAPHDAPARADLDLPQLRLQVPNFSGDVVESTSEGTAGESDSYDAVQGSAYASSAPAAVDAVVETVVTETVAPVVTDVTEAVDVPVEAAPEVQALADASALSDTSISEAVSATTSNDNDAETEALRQQLAALQAEFAALKQELQSPEASELASVAPVAVAPVAQAVAFDNSTSYPWDWQSQGEAAYGQYCSSCHQANGAGITGAFPSLHGHAHRFYNSAGGRYYLANVVVWGLKGSIDDNGINYNGVMSGIADASNVELAAALNYQLTSWGNDAYIDGDFYPIVPEDIMVAQNNPKTPGEVHALRARVLQGDVQVEDFVSLEANTPSATTSAQAAPAQAGSETTVATSESASDSAAAIASYDWDWQAAGDTAYSSHCSSCHQANGEGITGAFPSLKDHIPHIYNSAGGRNYLANLVLWGLQGAITAKGTPYNSVMTGINYASDQELAAALNHELTSWGNDGLIAGDFAPIVPEEIAAARANPKTMAEMYELRQTLDLP